ncbi:MAG: AbrB/MazE/SpoVT family DNA-binding domain-containing protein [Silvanigrellaceae bacterium]|nr:AbrB/MazE/SpoVT family DNA-binding domain-containing protein [Silvanigrellaceae bacterium]
MDNKTAKLSEKRQVTIPIEICKLLGIKPTDRIQFDVNPITKVASFRKLQPFENQWHKSIGSTLSEWEGNQDDDL